MDGTESYLDYESRSDISTTYEPESNKQSQHGKLGAGRAEILEDEEMANIINPHRGKQQN